MIEGRDQLERRDNFNRTEAEIIIEAFIRDRTGDDEDIFLHSTVPGVIAIDRLTMYVGKSFTWDELAAELARKTGHGVDGIVNCDWLRDDGPDEEATYIAFDIPSLPDDYRDQPRNMVYPVSPEGAPLPEDFQRRKLANIFINAHIEELQARLKYVTGDKERQAVEDFETLITVRNNGLEAFDREMVSAVLTHDVEEIRKVVEAREAAPQMGM